MNKYVIVAGLLICCAVCIDGQCSLGYYITRLFKPSPTSLHTGSYIYHYNH